MKRHWIILAASVVLTCSCGQPDTDTYLKKVIKKMETIQSATYTCRATTWSPTDDEPLFSNTYFYQEYNNPADTTIGASFASFKPEENMRFEGGYDGKVRISTYHDKKGVIEDDFTERKLPFRPVNPPFFNYTRNILQYAVETTDSIETSLVDEDSCYHFRLTIYEDRQVEFHGKATYIPTPPPEFYVEPTSHYEVWIRKSDNLPYKYLRKMSHDISQRECFDPTFNELSLADFNLYSYIPEDYEVRKYRSRSNRSQKKVYDLQDKPAPEWTLTATQDRPVSLKDIKSKVILLNFTGIGCGACQAAIPFLKELKGSYAPEDFELIAIESWSNRTSTRRKYAESKELNYLFLGADEKVLQDYQTGRSAPWFFLLDENHIVRKVIQGYSLERTGKEIDEAVRMLLK